MTNAVGGVDVFAEELSASPTGNIVEGMNHLNGDQALAFVRERHQLSEGDISRGKRQQAFIKALMLKGLSKDVLLNPINFAGFADAATKNLTVDNGFSMGTMRSEALQMRNLRGRDIYFTTAPFTGFGPSPLCGASGKRVTHTHHPRPHARPREDQERHQVPARNGRSVG